MNHTEKTIPVWKEIFFKCFRSSRILWNWRKEIETDRR